MAKRYFILLTALLYLPLMALAQKENPVLFTVEDTPVHESEFVYIYSKTNGKNATFSRESLEEYLDLYVKFKLKVQKAKEMKLDTIPQLMNELAGYRRQLADSYLIDKEVTEKLLREAYEHAQQDVDISHILITVPINPRPEDTLTAYQQAIAAKQRLMKEDFAVVAKEMSGDKSAQNNGGHIGYVTALFPNGFYELERAAYSMPLNKLSAPIRTAAGYHIVKVHDRRPARGEMEAAHILLRTEKKDNKAVKARIDSMYQALQAGASFEDMAKKFSEDSRTAAQGGYIGFFGINKYSRSFEDAVFALEKDGTLTKPVETNVGWHIIKRITRRGIQPYNIEKSRLENKVKRDNRFQAAKLAMVEQIKEEGNLKEYSKVLEEFATSLTDTFLTFRWRAPQEGGEALLFQYGDDYKVTLGDFASYLERATRKRMRGGSDTDIPALVQELYQDFVNESAMAYEEQNLENKYPDFKALMREYEEGILLFEATKMLVWDRASQDSSGLAEFYKLIEGKYRWEERAVTSIYRLDDRYKGQLSEVRAFAANHSPEEVMEKYGEADPPMLRHETKTMEYSVYPEFKSMEWKAGTLSQSEPAPKSSHIKFVKIEEILPAAMKTLDEARGYIVADYQDYLEGQWVEQLRKEYKVKINQDAFDRLVQ